MAAVAAGLTLVAAPLPAGTAHKRGLYLAPGAVDVEREGTHAVHYLVREAYPAQTTLTFILEPSPRMLAPRPVRWRARYEGSSHESGWDEMPVTEGPLADWVSAQFGTAARRSRDAEIHAYMALASFSLGWVAKSPLCVCGTQWRYRHIDRQCPRS